MRKSKNNSLELLYNLLIDKNLSVSVAESCTGGLISSMLTDVPGSSAYTRLNLVTYSNDAKIKILGVEPELIQQFSAVSEPVALSMAKGVRKLANTDIGVAVTGIAGPSGGSPEYPVGLVFVAISHEKRTEAYKINISPDFSRVQIKCEASKRVLELLKNFITNL